mmetsp:Transcript_1094/g.2121  ORF Transcript_1094/g.2121 Transcript_1094/m.2121 type:complete len:90 (-) Transcript_1094:308-577(-)
MAATGHFASNLVFRSLDQGVTKPRRIRLLDVNEPAINQIESYDPWRGSTAAASAWDWTLIFFVLALLVGVSMFFGHRKWRNQLSLRSSV